MRIKFPLMLFLILPFVTVTPRPVHDQDTEINTHDSNISLTKNDEVISVRITSSIAVDRGRGKSSNKHFDEQLDDLEVEETVSAHPIIAQMNPDANITHSEDIVSTSLSGANIDFIKQLHSKKEPRGTHHLEHIHPFQLQMKGLSASDTSNSKHPNPEEGSKGIIVSVDDRYDDIEKVPLGRSVALSPPLQNNINHHNPSEREKDVRLTTVSFNILHDVPKTITNFDVRKKPSSESLPDFQQVYSVPANVYSQPAKVYSEPAKFYSEPAKIYSEPAKIYSEPAKIYSEPAKIYSEPAKFYSAPASLHLPPPVETPIPTPWHPETSSSTQDSTTESTSEPSTTMPSTTLIHEIISERTHNVDEKEIATTGGQESNPENCKDDNCKVGYVVEGRQYRKYRVEERTSDGFIVGEYGVVRHEDGALRGVRYTADSDASPRLIHDALMKFLQL